MGRPCVKPCATFLCGMVSVTMPPVARAKDVTVAQHIADRMEALGMSKRGLAKALAGEGADHKQVENKRRAVALWLDRTIPEQKNAAALARVLGGETADFTEARPRRSNGVVGQAGEELAAAVAQIVRESARIAENSEVLARWVRDQEEAREQPSPEQRERESGP